MADDDDVDIYGDLTNFGEKSSEDCSEITLELKAKCTELEKKVANLEKELEGLRTIKNTLEVNLSSLVKTAKTEITRKDRMITELRSELENSLFRRDNYRIPKINRHNDVNNATTVESSKKLDNPLTKSELASAHVNDVKPIYSQTFIGVKNERNHDDDEDGCEEIYQPQKFASTIYGERLRRRLIEEDAAEKQKKQQLATDTSTSISGKPMNKNDSDTNSVSTNRNNEENRLHPVALNVQSVGISTQESLKRCNDENLSNHCNKRQKIVGDDGGNKNDIDNGKLQITNTPTSHGATNETINYRLEPIELRLLNLSQKHNEQLTVQKNSIDVRNNCRDKYSRRRSNSQPRSKDSSHHLDKRNNSSSRSRELNRQRDSERPDHYRSGPERSIEYKSEHRRDSKDRTNEKLSSGNRPRDTRNSTNYDPHKSGRKCDYRYETKNERKSHERREWPCRSQYDRINSNSQDTRNDDLRNKDRRKPDVENYGKRNNDSATSRKYVTQTSSEIKVNVVIENEVATSANSLEEGEIVDSPISTPQKDTLNTFKLEGDSKKTTTVDMVTDDLFMTPTLDTLKVITRRNCEKSPQEENIENIAGFIRNFTYDASNDMSSTMRVKDPDHRGNHHNTTNYVVEVPEYAVSETDRIQNPVDISTVNNIVELCKNNKENVKRVQPPTIEASLEIPNEEESVIVSLCDTKTTTIDTIPTNKTSTSYIDVVSKYVRKKRKPATSDCDPVIPEEDPRSLIEPIDMKKRTVSEKTIDSGPILPLCSQEQQNKVTHESVRKEVKEPSVTPASTPLVDSSPDRDTMLQKDTQNIIEIPANPTNNKKNNIVEIVNTKSETSETALKLSNDGSRIENTKSQIIVKKEGDHMRGGEKLTSVDNLPIPQSPNCIEKTVREDIHNSTNHPADSRIDEQQTVRVNNEENNVKEVKNISVSNETKTSEAPSTNNGESNCEEKTVTDFELRSNHCKKPVPTCTQNERRIVVARKKKRPVQLTNSSNSLTVVLSAYNVNNNRVCKSRMRTPVILSDT